MKLPRDARCLTVVLSLIGAGLIHLAAIRSHLGSAAAVGSFAGVGVLQILLGASLLRPGASRFKRLAVIGVGSLTVAAWLASRTWGLPALSGHSGPEPIGPADLAASGLQLIALIFAALPERINAGRHRRVLNVALALPLVAVTALASSHLLAGPEHGHAPVATRTARQEPPTPHGTPVLVKRTVPADHVDAPDGPAHSH